MTNKRLLFSMMGILAFVQCSQSEPGTYLNPDYPVENYNLEVLMDVNYEFNNEGLYKPWDIIEDPETRNIIVSDMGNNCLYFFTPDGKFIKRIGEKIGQGPGDLWKPRALGIDNSGNIYVYEDNNNRISIFNRNGDFLNSFRVNYVGTKSFYVNPETQEIIMSIPDSGYYITVFNMQGEIVQSIGKVLLSREKMGISGYHFYTNGSPIVDNSGNYYMFLPRMDKLIIYDKDGALSKEYSLSTLLKDNSWDQRYVPPESYVKGSFYSGIYLVLHVEYQNGYFYLKTMSAMGYNVVQSSSKLRAERNSSFIILDNDLNIVKRIDVPEKIPDFNAFIGPFEVLKDGKTILFPLVTEPTIFRLKPEIN